MVGLEFWAKEYLKAEGAFICCRIQYYILTYFRFIIIGVIASFEKGLRKPPAWRELHTACTIVKSTKLICPQTTEDTQVADPSEVNVESHFSVVDSFDMPAMRYDPVRSGFVQCVT